MKKVPQIINFIDKHQRLILAGLFVFIFSLFLIFILKSDYVFGGNDNFGHYKRAKYSWQFPYLFLDHWGKPVFTTLSSPFAQFGFTVYRVYNVIAALICVYFSILTVKKLKIKNTLLLVFFIVFAPIYAILMTTGLTEITFSMILMLAYFLFFNEKYIFSAISFSFLLFTRTESIVLFPFFIMAFIIRKQYKALPFLLISALFYSIVGYFHYKDFIWIINEMPYTGAKDIYGSGQLNHFLKGFHKIGGNILAYLFIIGFVISIIKWIKKPKLNDKNFEILLLFIFPFISYIAAHSYVWWKGIGGSLGLLRVIGAVIPLFSFMALIGVNSIINFFNSIEKRKILSSVFIIVILFFVIKAPFEKYNFPTPANKAYQVLKYAADFVIDEELLENRKLFYHNVNFYHLLDLNPYDSKTSQHYYVPNELQKVIPLGSIVLWDSSKSPNEGRVPKDRLMKSAYFKLIKVIKADEIIKVTGGYEFEVLVFERIKYNPNIDNYSNYKSLTLTYPVH